MRVLAGTVEEHRWGGGESILWTSKKNVEKMLFDVWSEGGRRGKRETPDIEVERRRRRREEGVEEDRPTR